MSSAKNSVSSLWHANNRLRGTHSVRSPELSEPKKISLSSAFEAVLPETVFGPFPSLVRAEGAGGRVGWGWGGRWPTLQRRDVGQVL